jgi:universal stress protein E
MKRFRNILFVSQGTPGEAEAFERALTLARNNGASLQAVRCLDGEGSGELLQGAPSGELQEELQGYRRQLEGLAEAARSGGLSSNAKLLFGEPAVEIIRHVLSERHDLVIKVAENGYGVAGALFGNIDMELMRRCPCAVWVLKAGGETLAPRILAAVDPDHPEEEGRQLNRLILELALALAGTEQSELHVAQCWTMPGESLLLGPFTPESREHMGEMLAEEEKRRRDHLDALMGEVDTRRPSRTHLIHGDARERLPALSRHLKIDLIVMGTLRRTGLPGLFIGNTAEEILRQVDCSVLTVKPEGFVSADEEG